MSTTILQTTQRREPCVAGVVAAATLCIGVSALSAALAAQAGFGGLDSAAGAAIWHGIRLRADPTRHQPARSLRADGNPVRPAAARLRFYVGPDDPFSEFARRPLQGWFYVYGSPGDTDRLNWDPLVAPATAAFDTSLALRTLKVHFEVEVPAFPSSTRGSVTSFTHTARFHWELPIAFGIDRAAAQWTTAPQRPEPGPPSAALTLPSLARLPARRRRRQPGNATARGSPLH